MCEPTHKLGNVLDLALTNQPNIIEDFNVCYDSLPFTSDHFPVFLNITVKSLRESAISSHLVYNYSKTDIDGLEDCWLDQYLDLCYETNNIDSVWQGSKSIFTKHVKMYTPKIKLHSHPQPVWFTSEIRHKLNIIHSLRKRA